MTNRETEGPFLLALLLPFLQPSKRARKLCPTQNSKSKISKSEKHEKRRMWLAVLVVGWWWGPLVDGGGEAPQRVPFPQSTDKAGDQHTVRPSLPFLETLETQPHPHHHYHQLTMAPVSPPSLPHSLTHSGLLISSK